MTALVLTLTLSISAYTPGANTISGGRIMANGQSPYVGAFACPRTVPLGWRVTIIGDAAAIAQRMGLPTTGWCADRFHARHSACCLDIAIPVGMDGMDDQQRLKRAFAWGRRRGIVVFRPPISGIPRQ